MRRGNETIRTTGVNVRLTTYGCPASGGSRPPNREERQILDLWNKFDLSAPGANLELVWPFLSQLRSCLGLRAA
jgi:hypothetical protein